jgi:hypothetical protein
MKQGEGLKEKICALLKEEAKKANLPLHFQLPLDLALSRLSPESTRSLCFAVLDLAEKIHNVLEEDEQGKLFQSPETQRVIPFPSESSSGEIL